MDLLRVFFYFFSILFCIAEGRLFRVDYTFYPEIDGYLKLHVVPLNWHDAFLTCEFEGAVLASPKDTSMLTTMETHFKSQNTSHCAYYTGTHSKFSKGQFFSIDGVPLSKMPVKWAAGEPDNANNNEDCMVLADGTAADVNCTELFPFMCFKKKTKNMIITSCGTVDNDYQFNPSTSNCYKFHRHGRTWLQAQLACASEGGYLAVVNSQVEAQYLKTLFDQNVNKITAGSSRDVIHVGFQDWDDLGVWRTVHGMKIEDAGYAEWNPNQPDSVNKIPRQRCGAMFRSAKFDDYWCDGLAAFVCEKSLDSLLDYSISD